MCTKKSPFSVPLIQVVTHRSKTSSVALKRGRYAEDTDVNGILDITKLSVKDDIVKTTLLAATVALTLVCFSAEDASAFGLCNKKACDSNSCCDESPCALGCCEVASACDEAVASCDSCGACGQSASKCSCLGRMKLFGCLKPSDHCFDDFISPMINFVFFEDPRTLTELRPIYVNHTLPNQVGSLNLPGGSVQLYAMQIRLALTERLSLIAVKDGFIVEDLEAGPLDDLIDDGWAAVTAGLKYNVLRDTRRGRLASVGFTYELPVGSARTLQDIADGEFHVFGTAGCRYLDGNAHFLSSVGYRFPVDSKLQTSSIHWSNHLDLRLTKCSYVFTEWAWWNWTDSAGNGAPIGVAGQDLFNLSASNMGGKNLLTQNIGLKHKPNGNMEAGVAFEFPLSDFDDVIKNRLQLDLILRY